MEKLGYTFGIGASFQRHLSYWINYEAGNKQISKDIFQTDETVKNSLKEVRKCILKYYAGIE